MHTDATPGRALRLAAVPLMLLAGAFISVQAQINGNLATELGDGPRAGILAAVVSFGVGLAFLTLVTLVVPARRRQVAGFFAALAAGRIGRLEAIGGLLGAFLVATQGLAVGTIGVALFAVAVTAGQAASALWVDHVGLGPSGKQGISLPRLVAALFAVVAVVLATAERSMAEFEAIVLVLAGLSLLAGAGTSVQQALNGRVSAQAGPWATTLNNFVVGLAGLVVAFVLSLLRPGHIVGFPADAWLYTGGFLGVCFIWLAALLVKVYGVLVLSLSIIAGQVIGAVLIEALGEDARVGATGYLASGLTVLGVAVALGVRRRTAASVDLPA